MKKRKSIEPIKSEKKESVFEKQPSERQLEKQLRELTGPENILKAKLLEKKIIANKQARDNRANQSVFKKIKTEDVVPSSTPLIIIPVNAGKHYARIRSVWRL